MASFTGSTLCPLIKAAITHYAPIKETVVGEPEPIFPFLGSSRLQRALDRHKPTLAVHGHAHKGTFAAESSTAFQAHPDPGTVLLHCVLVGKALYC